MPTVREKAGWNYLETKRRKDKMPRVTFQATLSLFAIGVMRDTSPPGTCTADGMQVYAHISGTTDDANNIDSASTLHIIVGHSVLKF